MNYPNNTIKTISEFLFYETEIKSCDIAIVLGNDHIKTMDSVKLLIDKKTIKGKVILTGHSAKKDKEPEAIRFFNYGKEIGVSENTMIIEPNATNSLENLLFSKVIIEEKLGGFNETKTIMFVAKAFVTRRIIMTAQSLYPHNIEYIMFPTVDEEGKNIKKDNWWNNESAKKRVLEELKRISEYTLKGDLSLL